MLQRNGGCIGTGHSGEWGCVAHLVLFVDLALGGGAVGGAAGVAGGGVAALAALDEGEAGGRLGADLSLDGCGVAVALDVHVRECLHSPLAVMLAA